MPIYEYECEKCGERFELLLSFDSSSEKVCPKCGGKAKKIISPSAGFIFKGTGFYKTDYKDKPAENNTQVKKKVEA
ncbi:zinc ribbon domain-containing protein [candidate division WOR-3 bacterium]|nr:zinc ribbon domain-containing protein [candidate division WOR-3 bacterium]